jgi:hypothetical protein
VTGIPPQDRPRPLDDPARSLGIIGLIFSVSGIFCGLVGLLGAIISTVAFVRSRNAGFANRWALAGIIVGLSFFALSAVLFLFFPTTVPAPPP